jgi:lysophospholipase L1-like esterase
MRPPTRFRRSFFSLGLLAAMVAALLAGAPAAAATASPPLGPRHYYLSLGDSFGFGLQVTRWAAMVDAGTYTPDAFNTGYTDDLAAMIRARLRPDLQVVNYSCPASGTGEMLRADGCFFQQIGLALHDEFSGSQLDAATAFLRANPGQVSPITISIGTADMLSAIEDCSAAPVCVARSGVFRTLRENLTVILGRLRAAAPTADILLLLPHNVTVVDFPGDNPLWAAFVLELRTIAAAHEVRVADAFAAITLSGRTCELTFACLPGDLADSHPNDAGYAVMARLFYRAAGYSRL